MPTLSPIVREIESLLKSRYASANKGEGEKIIEGVQSFLSRVPMNNSMQRLLQDAARSVHSIFGFQEVSVGMKDQETGKLRYYAVVGYTKEAEDALKKASYTSEEFWSQKEFPSVRVSKILDMLVGENQPSLEKEKKCWNRPTQLVDQRKSAEDFTENDYLDVYLFSSGTDLLGWIEVSAPRDGKMPSGQALRGLELFASSLAVAVQLFSSRSW
jgi:hypothetical protein